ncbi:MAG: YceI family protein [Sulfurovum sp.]|uniref:YceI family protein n=1 Tax=Sulfurovum sp. TaxID=1969726 RepID=UPI003C7197CE
MKKAFLLVIMATTTYLTAGNLVVTNGQVKAHTEVFGDSSINPSTTGLNSHLTMGKNIESIRGSIDISMSILKSDNKDRDEHMLEAIEDVKYPVAKYTFKDVVKSDNGYIVNGILYFHGVKKPLVIQAKIMKSNKKVNFKGTSSFLMSSYDVKPPKMLFLTVRDQIDLDIDVKFETR